MRFSTALPILALAAGLVNAQNNNNQNQNQNQGGNGGNNNALVLNPANVQNTGNGLADAEPGQAASDTDPANFINLCTGKTLTNGLQNQQGSCNPIPMGDIPAKNKMISAAFVNPKNNDVIQLINNDPNNNTLNFQVQITNLEAGSFTNPDDTYYAAPQALGNSGTIIGHTHIVAQDLGGDINTSDPPDPTIFAFFKGVNDDGNGQGLLSAALVGGLAPGAYRVCSMTSASNHQPVLMPVAQRGAQDDCVRFTVKAANGGQGGGQGGNNGGQQQGGQGGGAASSTGTAAQASAVAGNGQGGGKGGQRFGKGGQRFGRPRKFTAREFVA